MKRQRSNAKWAALFWAVTLLIALSLPLALFLNNEESTTNEQSSLPKVTIRSDSRMPASAATGQPVQIRHSLQAPPESRLMAVLDHKCMNRANLKRQSVARLSQKISLPVGRIASLQSRQAYPFAIDPNNSLSDLVAEADADPCVLAVTENHTVHTNFIFSDPKAPLQTHLNYLHTSGALNFFYSPYVGITHSVVVAIVDTGVDYKHEDLMGQMWTDAQGSHGYNFIANSSDPMDDYFHGTHLAGIIAAAANNKLGGAGLNGQQAKIMAVKVLDQNGSGTDADVLNGIYWAVDHGADVINLSLGSTGTNSAYSDALAYATSKNVFVAIAAGNGGSALDANANFECPAGYAKDSAGAIAVAAIETANGNLAGFSNFNPSYVEIAAPGVNILSTYPTNKGKYNTLSGTSQATPMVAAAASLVIGFLRSQNKDASPSKVKATLLSAAIQKQTLKTQVANGNSLDMQALADFLNSSFITYDSGGLSGN